MLRVKEIQEELMSLIGWAPDKSLATVLSDSLTRSDSGMYFQQVHPLLTLTNLLNIAPDFNNMAELDIATATYKKQGAYSLGDIVSYQGTYFRAIVDNAKSENIGKNDGTWEETSPFSLWLESKTKASIIKAVDRFCTEKVAGGATKTLCENKALFESTGRIVDKVTNKNDLVGFEIVPIRAKGVTTKINKIGLNFTAPGTYKLYLFHSSSAFPIKVIELEKKTKGFEWLSVKDLFLPYQGKSTDAGGSWYLCYAQSELPEGSQAIKKDKDWSKGPCKECTRGEYLSWIAWSKYIEIHPFYINENESALDDDERTLWDISKNVYTYDNNYGINLDVSVYCDVTDFIIDHKEMFRDVIAKQVAVDFLREFAYNPSARANRSSINASKQDILYEIDGDSSSMKKSGLSYQLEQAFKALSMDVRGIDRVCFPCKNNGIKYFVV